MVAGGSVGFPLASPGAAVTALDRAADLGPYFRVERSVGTSLSLDVVVDAHARRLGTGERRVAASILHQELAARLWSPVLACALDGVLLDLDGVGWSSDPIRLHLPRGRGWVLPARGNGELVANAVLGHLLPLGAALRAVVRLPELLLLGNAASALVGTAVVAELGGRTGARHLAEAMLELPALHAAGTVGEDGAYRRASCCLYYRLPGGGLCGDCPLPG